jgi:hypothetical protein
MRSGLLLVTVLLACSLSSVGCTGTRPSKQKRVEPDESKAQLNRLWEQGYGFNNPNNERIKQGLPPEPFFKEEEEEFEDVPAARRETEPLPGGVDLKALRP